MSELAAERGEAIIIDMVARGGLSAKAASAAGSGHTKNWKRKS